MENKMPPEIPEELRVPKSEVEIQEVEEVVETSAVEQPVKNVDGKFVLTIFALIFGCSAYILRGFAIYSVWLALVVLLISVAGVVCALLSYQKEAFLSLIALIVTISACGSCVSLVTSFGGEKLFGPQPQETYDMNDDISQYFGDFPEYFDNGNSDNSDYFWD